MMTMKRYNEYLVKPCHKNRIPYDTPYSLVGLASGGEGPVMIGVIESHTFAIMNYDSQFSCVGLWALGVGMLMNVWLALPFLCFMNYDL